jgi:putative FmdB family regulatory protein
MPIYEYQCADCGHRLEVICKMSDAPLVDCPACAHPALRKLLSAPAFHLKGSGWYQTDFKGGAKKPTGGSEAIETSTAESKETKEAAKSKDAVKEPVNKNTEAAGTQTKPPASDAA